MVEVVFHVGAHKCATTAIQRGLKALAPSRPDLLYVPPSRPKAPGASDVVTPELTNFCRFVRKKRGSGLTRAAVADDLCRLIERNPGKARIVFSEEAMLGLMPGLAWSFYPRAHAARAVLDAVASRFPTSVLLQSRDSYSYLRSCHQFRVRFGATTSFLAMLERFDLDSLSWSALGKTLFDGARYRWRVAPLEAFRDPAAAASVDETLEFLAPGWDRAVAPLAVVNPANPPLLRAATLVLGRAGVRLDNQPDSVLASIVNRADAEIAEAAPARAEERIASAFAEAGVVVPPALVPSIRIQAEEERIENGSLRKLLTERFAPDYAKFLKRYGPDGGRAG